MWRQVDRVVLMSIQTWTYTSRCKYCGLQIVWKDKRPFDAVSYSSVYIQGPLHFNTCPYRKRQEIERNCPVCQLVRNGVDAAITYREEAQLCLKHDTMYSKGERLTIYNPYIGTHENLELSKESLAKLASRLPRQIRADRKKRQEAEAMGKGLEKWLD